MLEKVISEEDKKVESQEDRKREEVRYIANLVEENYDGLREVFDPNSSIPQGELSRFLYEQTRETIERLGKRYVRVIGVSVWHHPEEPKDPEFQLGWAGAFECGFGEKARVLRITKKGTEIINKLREIRGLYSIEESKKRFRESWYGKR